MLYGRGRWLLNEIQSFVTKLLHAAVKLNIENQPSTKNQIQILTVDISASHSPYKLNYFIEKKGGRQKLIVH